MQPQQHQPEQHQHQHKQLTSEQATLGGRLKKPIKQPYLSSSKTRTNTHAGNALRLHNTTLLLLPTKIITAQQTPTRRKRLLATSRLTMINIGIAVFLLSVKLVSGHMTHTMPRPLRFRRMYIRAEKPFREKTQQSVQTVSTQKQPRGSRLLTPVATIDKHGNRHLASHMTHDGDDHQNKKKNGFNRWRVTRNA